MIDLTVNVEAAIADLATIESVVPAQVARIVAQAAQRYEARGRATTPVGKGQKRNGQRLSTGWQRRQMGPHRIHVVNVRPHAHLAAEGFAHVGGKQVAAFVPWIQDAMTTRDAMVTALTRLVGPDFPVPLRALDVRP